MNEKSILSFVFDFDGTLVDTNKLKREAFFSIASETKNGLQTMQRLHNVIDGDRLVLWQRWAAELGLPDASALHYNARYSKVVDKKVVAAPEMLGATTLLELLQERKKKIYLNSATPQKNLVQIVKARGWASIFDGVFGAPTTKVENLRSKILTETDASLTVVIGDGKDDQESAILTGCQFFPVGDPKNRTLKNSKQTFSLNQLANIFES